MSPLHHRIVCDVLRKHLSVCVKAWVFGSRADWTTRDSSDLDIALEGRSKIHYRTMADLENAFEESDLPYTVDIIDMNAVTENFKRIVEKQMLPLYLAEQGAVADWCEMPFDQAVILNPPTGLKRGNVYPYVDMASLTGPCHTVHAREQREFNGSGTEFRHGDTLVTGDAARLKNQRVVRYHSHDGRPYAHGPVGLTVVRGRPDITDNSFAYYMTRWKKIPSHEIEPTGTPDRQVSEAGFTDGSLVCLPPVPRQRIIADILASLDERIEINRRMNCTLKEISRKIYRSWFVDFAPIRGKMSGRWVRGRSLPGLPAHLYDLFPDDMAGSRVGTIPKGWDVTSLDRMADFHVVTAPQGCNSNMHLSGHSPVNAARPAGDVDGRRTKDANPECTAHEGDVVFSWSKSPHVMIWRGEYADREQNLFKVTSRRYPKWFYLLCLELHLGFPTVTANDETPAERAMRDYLNDVQCAVPGNDLLDAADGLFGCMLAKQLSNAVQSRSLAALRDMLLPRLMSGTVQIPPSMQDMAAGQSGTK